mmetsp:Transcript_26948/g.48936  ORF Transcript_26948/g.48936 Transcript_26948/m.48936 type:complete len:792 (+) Transcript_26948:61-2436(+)|eukprot:CAMPEP_0196141954 /NCGR_PEP_ID=MMETSP0910-20130528/10729_1 /TAXON_ID=49265 /ORGANISM="Thalassiosira rotula, Strain GSO102" /LENGTH=791 /DNA_ID=CAMNT_0041403193 /DNA_START=62 /DNA_END=2437 /DNA_ORIENTATION=+
MIVHHIALGVLIALLSPVSTAASASNGGIARISNIEHTPRPGRLLRSSVPTENRDDSVDGDDGSHHGQVQLTLFDAAELIEAASIELSLPSLHSSARHHETTLYTYDLDWRDEVGGGWHGKLRDDGDAQQSVMGTAHFVASPLGGLQENRLAGMIYRGDGTTLRITTKPDGTHWFEIWDETETQADASEDEGVEGRRRLEDLEEEDLDWEVWAVEEDQEEQQEINPGDDDGTVIDHLSVYTRRGMCEHALVGFYPCPSTPYIRAPIEEFIALQITVMNYVLQNTHVNTKLNSVHVFMDPDYDQETDATGYDGSPISVALGHLGNVDGGHFEEARRRRNLYCADLMTLFGTNGLGLAQVGGSNSFINHGSGGWGFSHEIGHNLNAGHRNDDRRKTGFKYGYGTGDSNSDAGPSDYSTIMAFGGKKVPMFSTPDYQWDNKDVGTATENNRQSIINHLLTTANYRRSEMCNASCEYGSEGTGPLGCPLSCSTCHFPSDFCYNDPFFLYEGNFNEDCEWVRSRQGKCDRTVITLDGRDRKVRDHCPVSCGTCPDPTPAPTDAPAPEICEDDPEYFNNGKASRGCDWVAESIETRCSENAGSEYGLEKIYDYCRLTCNMCHIDLTPPPSPTPCADIPGNHFKSNQYGCEWIAEDLDRCDSKSMARTHCRETCGLCNPPTQSPTIRGECADDEDWVFEAPKDKYSFLTCAWVREDPEDRCNHSRMKHYCPHTCNTCCEDERDWHKWSNEEKTCAYYADAGCSSLAKRKCPRSCGQCPNYLAHTGGPAVRRLRKAASA